jgi:TfoX/Sxy family transcriptional regulator of competence genes
MRLAESKAATEVSTVWRLVSCRAPLSADASGTVFFWEGEWTMAYYEQLTNRVRAALPETPKVTEKRMFSGVGFTVDEKLCVSVGDDRIMLRVDPELHDSLVRKSGCSPMIMKGREYRGYMLVEEAVLKRPGRSCWLGSSLRSISISSRSRRKRNTVRTVMIELATAVVVEVQDYGVCDRLLA